MPKRRSQPITDEEFERYLARNRAELARNIAFHKEWEKEQTDNDRDARADRSRDPRSEI